MIHHSSLTEHIESLIRMSQASQVESLVIDSAESLFEHYTQSLSQSQGRPISACYQRPEIISDPALASTFCSLMSQDALSMLDDKGQDQVISMIEDPQAKDKAVLISRAIDALLIISPEYKALFDLTITEIFLMPSNCARGGSTSSAIGVIWANPRLSYNVPDTIEFLIHELTHHALFVDEQHHGHYDYDLILERDTWCRSAILNIDRPLDKVFHSLMVAAEIVMLRENYLGHPESPRVHPPTQLLKKQIREAIRSIEKLLGTQIAGNQEMVSPRFLQLLGRVASGLNL